MKKDKLPQNLTEKYFHWFFSLPLVSSDPGHCKGLWEVSPQSIACEANWRPQHMTKMTCVTCFSLAYPQPLLVCLDLRCSWNSASKHFQGHRRDASRLLTVSYPQDCPRTFLGTLLLLLGSLLQLQLQIASFQLSNSGRGLRAARREVTIGCITYQVFIRTHWPTCSAALQQFFSQIFDSHERSDILYTLFLSSLISQTLTLRIFSGELTTSHKQRHFRHV